MISGNGSLRQESVIKSAVFFSFRIALRYIPNDGSYAEGSVWRLVVAAFPNITGHTEGDSFQNFRKVLTTRNSWKWVFEINYYKCFYFFETRSDKQTEGHPV